MAIVSSNKPSATFVAWSPTITGFSANPTGGVHRYSLNGKKCTVYTNFTGVGTSNATSKTITLPFAAANTVLQNVVNQGQDAGVGAYIRITTRLNSNVADLYPSATTTSWTATGNCIFRFSFTYEIA